MVPTRILVEHRRAFNTVLHRLNAAQIPSFSVGRRRYLARKVFSDDPTQKTLLGLSGFILCSTIGICYNACVIWDNTALLVNFEKFIEITTNATRLFVKSNIFSSPLMFL